MTCSNCNENKLGVPDPELGYCPTCFYLKIAAFVGLVLLISLLFYILGRGKKI